MKRPSDSRKTRPTSGAGGSGPKTRRSPASSSSTSRRGAARSEGAASGRARTSSESDGPAPRKTTGAQTRTRGSSPPVNPRKSSQSRSGARKPAANAARPNPGVTARRSRVDHEAGPEDSRPNKRGAGDGASRPGARGDARSRGGADDAGRSRGDGGKAGPRGLKVIKPGPGARVGSRGRTDRPAAEDAPGAKVGSRGRSDRPGAKVGSRGRSDRPGAKAGVRERPGPKVGKGVAHEVYEVYDSGKPVPGVDTPPRRGSAVERLLAGGQPGDRPMRPPAIRDQFADKPTPAKRSREEAPVRGGGGSAAPAKRRVTEGGHEAPAKRRVTEGGNEAPAKRRATAETETEAPAKRRATAETENEAPAKRRVTAEGETEAPAKRRATAETETEAPAKRRATAETETEAPAKRRATAETDAPSKPRAAKPADDAAKPGVARSVRGWSETPTGKPKRAAARPGGNTNPIKGPERLVPAKVRLQKVLASAGVAARRKAEDLIARGRVTVNGRVANELGVKVDPERDQIRVDGKVVQVETRVYFVLNKPDGVVCSAEGTQDAEGRPTVLSLMPTVSQRIYPVGRLDYHTRGVLILTNDGDLAAALTHPRHKVTKTYHVKFQGRLGDSELAALGQGITLDDGVVTRPAEEISIIKETETNTWVQLTLRQGLNRQVRRMGDAIGHPVLKLIRVAIGPVNADGLEDGEFRPLTPTEVYDLMAAASR